MLCLVLATCACTPSDHPGRTNHATRTVSPWTHGTLTKSPPPGNKRVSMGTASVVIPKRWFSAGYHGVVATVAAPIMFFSSAPIVTRCSKPTQRVCTSSDWFPRDVTTPTKGVLVSWLGIEMPTDAQWAVLPGRRIEIRHHIAKVYAGVSDDGCPVVTAREVRANVRIPTKPIRNGKTSEYSGERLEMTACFGSNASADDRAAVERMLHSLRIRP
jgi:hypothetical protein